MVEDDRERRGWFFLLACLILLSLPVVDASVLNASATGANSKTYLQNYQDLVAGALQSGINSTVQYTVSGKTYLSVPEFQTSTYCRLDNSNLTTTYLGSSVNSTLYEVRSDAFSEAGIVLAMSNRTNEFDYWVNFLEEMDLCGAGQAPCWVVARNNSVAGAQVRLAGSQNDTAIDGTVRAAIALYTAVNNTAFTSANRTRYLSLANNITAASYQYETIAITTKATRAGVNVTRLPMGGMDCAASGLGCGTDMWIGYGGDIIKAFQLAYYYTGNETYNAAARNFTAAFYSVSTQNDTDGDGYGVAPFNFNWDTSAALLGHAAGGGVNTYHYDAANPQWDDSDAPRFMNFCDILRVQNLTGQTINGPYTNVSEYCAKASGSSTYNATRTSLQYFYPGTCASNCNATGYYENGLGVYWSLYQNTSFVSAKVNETLTHASWTTYQFDSTSCGNVLMFRGSKMGKALGSSIGLDEQMISTSGGGGGGGNASVCSFTFSTAPVTSGDSFVNISYVGPNTGLDEYTHTFVPNTTLVVNTTYSTGRTNPSTSPASTVTFYYNDTTTYVTPTDYTVGSHVVQNPYPGKVVDRMVWYVVRTPPVYQVSLSVDNVWARPVTPTLVFQANNTVNDTSISSFCVNITGAGQACTTTGLVYLNNLTNCTMNATAYNISTSTYYNVTQTNYVFNTTDSYAKNITFQTYQALLNFTARRLYLNTSISSFNATNNKVTNTTTTGTLYVPANNGTNNIILRVLGNHTNNVTCAVAAPLTTSACGNVDFYDSLLQVNATNGTVKLNGFTIQLVNTTIVNTTNYTSEYGIILPTLQGYAYYLGFNKTGLTTSNTVLTLTSLYTNYSFSLVPAPSVNFTLYDEVTNTRITENMTIEIINNEFSENYTITNGSIQRNLSGRVGNTIFRYYNENYQQRDYIIDLDPNTNYNVRLYDILINESQTVTITVVDTSNTPVQNATVSLLRYFVDCNCYRTVQMTQTASDGTGLFFVQAIDGHYKWSISYLGTTYFLSTTSEQINSDTRNFVISLGSDFYSGWNTLPGLAWTGAYNEVTGALTFTWNDPESVVSGACLDARVLEGIRYVSIGATCAAGASGSAFLVLDNTTDYKYSFSVNTTNTYTPYITVTTGSIEHPGTNVFGDMGVFLAIAILVVLVTLFSFSAIATLLVTAAGVIIISFLGIMTFTAAFITGLCVLVLGIALFLMRS